MSYLDQPMTRETYLNHIKTKSASYKKNSMMAIDWFNKFCIGYYEGRNERIVLDDLLKLKYSNPQKFNQSFYGMLQDFINYLGENEISPTTLRGYFILVKKYLNYQNFGIYNEDVKARLNFTKAIAEELHPLTREDIKKILNEASPKRRALYLFLASSGMRIQETLKLRKRDLDTSFERIMVRIPGKYTKTGKPRKTFVTKEAENLLKPILDSKKDDDLIFADNTNSLVAKHTEEDYFHRLRKRAGLTEKYDTGIHKITLHSFRSFFVTKCNRIDSDLGNALAGHDKYMKQYNKMTDEEKVKLYIKAENSLSIYDFVNEDSDMVKQSRAKINEQDERIRNLEIMLTDYADFIHVTKQTLRHPEFVEAAKKIQSDLKLVKK